jgi:hypothetical protein
MRDASECTSNDREKFLKSEKSRSIIALSKNFMKCIVTKYAFFFTVQIGD